MLKDGSYFLYCFCIRGLIIIIWVLVSSLVKCWVFFIKSWFLYYFCNKSSRNKIWIFFVVKICIDTNFKNYGLIFGNPFFKLSQKLHYFPKFYTYKILKMNKINWLNFSQIHKSICCQKKKFWILRNNFWGQRIK